MSIQELQQIKGIGPKYARMLVDAGIANLDDLAAATPDDLQAIVQARGGLNRYEDWIQQARALVNEKAERVSQEEVERTEGVDVVTEAASAASPVVETSAVQSEASLQREALEAELQDVMAELNELAAELKRLAPQFQPPPYTPQRMKMLLVENLDRFAPETVKSLQESLDGTTIEDFKDFETWKGVWFTINYLIKLEASERTHALAERLSRLPGISTLADLKEMLQDTPPEEFLNPETWKGVWFLINYELKNTASGLKKRLRGASADRSQEDEQDAWGDTWE